MLKNIFSTQKLMLAKQGEPRVVIDNLPSDYEFEGWGRDQDRNVSAYVDFERPSAIMRPLQQGTYSVTANLGFTKAVVVDQQDCLKDSRKKIATIEWPHSLSVCSS